MVTGFAGIFGGNERTTPVSGIKATQVRQTQAKLTHNFAPALKAAVHTPTEVGQKTAIPAKSLTAGGIFSSGASLPAAKSRAVVSRAATSEEVSTSADSSITLVNGLPPVTTPGTTASPVTTTTTPPPATPAVTTDPSVSPTPVVDTLKAALVQAGLDISGMQFTEHSDLVTYPGGSYINDIISMKTSTGQSHDYMTNLVAIDPQVTVNEVVQLLAGNRG